MDHAINKTCGVPYLACIVEWCVAILLVTAVAGLLIGGVCEFIDWMGRKK